MKSRLRRLGLAALLAMIALNGLSACKEKGPAEKAGEKIDEAVQDTKRAVEDATD